MAPESRFYARNKYDEKIMGQYMETSGGGALNWSFIQAGMCGEVKDGGSVWLRYKVRPEKGV